MSIFWHCQFRHDEVDYFGVVPILTNAVAACGISPIKTAGASVLGQPARQKVISTLLLAGMSDVSE